MPNLCRFGHIAFKCDHRFDPTLQGSTCYSSDQNFQFFNSNMSTHMAAMMATLDTVNIIIGILI